MGVKGTKKEERTNSTIGADIDHFRNIAIAPGVFRQLVAEEIDHLTGANLADWEEPELRFRLARVAGMLAVLAEQDAVRAERDAVLEAAARKPMDDLAATIAEIEAERAAE